MQGVKLHSTVESDVVEYAISHWIFSSISIVCPSLTPHTFAVKLMLPHTTESSVELQPAAASEIVIYISPFFYLYLL